MEFGVQQLQLGKILTSSKNASKALRIMSQSHYSLIELNGFMIRKSPFIVRLLTSLFQMPIKKSYKMDWKKLVKKHDLKVISIHEDLDTIETKMDLIKKECEDYQCHYIVVTGMYNYDYSSYKEVEALAKRLNDAGKKLKESNISLLYHNHNVEFVHVDKNHLAYDLLIEKTNPNYVNFEFDSYWPSVSGVDVLSYMKKLGSRIILHHICDNGNLEKGNFITPIIKNKAVELGYGQLNLQAMLNQDMINNTKYVILEQHNHYLHDDPLESLIVSSDYLQQFKKSHIKA